MPRCPFLQQSTFTYLNHITYNKTKNQHGISILECTWRCLYLKSILNRPSNHNFVACMWRCKNLKYMINTNQGINIEYALSEYAWRCTYLTYITGERQVKRPTWHIWFQDTCEDVHIWKIKSTTNQRNGHGNLYISEFMCRHMHLKEITSN